MSADDLSPTHLHFAKLHGSGFLPHHGQGPHISLIAGGVLTGPGVASSHTAKVHAQRTKPTDRGIS